MMKAYPRYITPGFEPFDPVELARETERVICRNDERKYTAFYATGVYQGIGTGYTCGCCLRCVFCWMDWSRAEPTLGKQHLLALLERVEGSEFDIFILETNGILFGVDRDYVRAISKFEKPHVRVSLKAGTPEAFTRKTGAKPESFELPFKAIRNLMDYGVSFHVAGMMDDPRIVTPEERVELIEKLAEIDQRLVRTFEGDVIDPYETTLARLKFAGLELEWPLKRIYRPLRLLP